MFRQQLPLPGELVKKSNAIARARWQPESIWEPRIIALVASKVRENDEDFHTYKIPVSELTGASDENLSGSQYQEIAKSISHLGKATIRIEGITARNFRQYTIFAMCGYEDGHLIAGFHPDLKPHFLNLKAQFTAYNLFEYLLLPSSYSQRIFEILKSWSNTPEVVISVAELHDTLNTPESFRKDFRQFRIRVLEKAHKDITTHTSLIYEWEPIKKGRSVTEIKFVFSKHRVAIVNKTNNEKNQEKIINRNNKIFIQANNCAKQHKGACLKDEQKNTAVCNLCRELKMLKEYNRLNSGK